MKNAVLQYRCYIYFIFIQVIKNRDFFFTIIFTLLKIFKIFNFSSHGSFSALRSLLLLYVYVTVCLELLQRELQSGGTARWVVLAP